MTKQEVEKEAGNEVFEDLDENTNWESPDDLNEIAIDLTEEQVEFLTHWEPDLLTKEQNNEFIESLRVSVIKQYK